MTTPPLLQQIEAEEHLNVIGRPEKWQVIDFIGIAYGAYFIWDGWSRPRPKVLNVMIGSTMVYIHAERFFYAPQTPRKLSS